MGTKIDQRSNKYMIPKLEIGESAIIPYLTDRPTTADVERMRQAVYIRGKFQTSRTELGLWILRLK